MDILNFHAICPDWEFLLFGVSNLTAFSCTLRLPRPSFSEMRGRIHSKSRRNKSNLSVQATLQGRGVHFDDLSLSLSLSLSLWPLASMLLVRPCSSFFGYFSFVKKSRDSPSHVPVQMTVLISDFEGQFTIFETVPSMAALLDAATSPLSQKCLVTSSG